MKELKVCVKFFSDKRKDFPSLNYAYRPHFVADGDDELLGVEFVGSDLTEFDCYGEAIVKLLYDGVDYSKLSKDVKFSVVEAGHRIVGNGYVLN